MALVPLEQAQQLAKSAIPNVGRAISQIVGARQKRQALEKQALSDDLTQRLKLERLSKLVRQRKAFESFNEGEVLTAGPPPRLTGEDLVKSVRNIEKIQGDPNLSASDRASLISKEKRKQSGTQNIPKREVDIPVEEMRASRKGLEVSVNNFLDNEDRPRFQHRNLKDAMRSMNSYATNYARLQDKRGYIEPATQIANIADQVNEAGDRRSRLMWFDYSEDYFNKYYARPEGMTDKEFKKQRNVFLEDLGFGDLF